MFSCRPSCLLRFVLLLFVGLEARAGDVDRQIRELEMQWSHALVQPDLNRLGKLMDDQMSYGHASGRTEGKRSYLDRIRSGAQKYLSFSYDPGSTGVRVERDTALVTATAHVRSVTDGKANSPHLRLLHVWLRRDGEWKLWAHQSTALPE